MLKKKNVKKNKDELIFKILLKTETWAIQPYPMEGDIEGKEIIILSLKEIIKELQKDIRKEKKSK